MVRTVGVPRERQRSNSGTSPGPARGWLPDVDRRLDRLESPVETLLEPELESGTVVPFESGSSDVSLASADRIIVVPDAHYPFHPSTGVVTDPALVGAVASLLAFETDADVAVGLGGGDALVDTDRIASYLGYRSLLERLDADLVDLDDEPRTQVTPTLADRPVPLWLPERLLEGRVVVVPSLRPTEDGPIAGGMRTLGAIADGPENPPLAAVAATRAVDPVTCVLDAVVAYGDGPYAADALLAGPTRAVDALGSSLLERTLADDWIFSRAYDNNKITVTVDQRTIDDASAATVDLDALQTALGGGALPPSGETNPAVSAAYGVYAAVSGDAVPPQMEGSR
ncbi:hypothetical protein B1756_10875 [Natrarchaeobaculum aegyptiacum]|uniref:DUF362 domain-containing protein n=1 Tax=Natrarchaeobaculum aegyptiacum TaxID=745377 RepID=A0A2Z2I0A2_9EURY|nr:hypothetical protein B1756_10875 [Natrarchaeobaculum aegyptiacum]